MNREIYLKDPCGTYPIPFWKMQKITLPENMKVIHHRDYNEELIRGGSDTLYFRVIHDLKQLSRIDLAPNYEIKNVDVLSEIYDVVDIINKCYEDISVTKEQVKNWTKERVFREDLWIFIVDKEKKRPIALGIADLDEDMQEGVLEWIQVLPEYRGRGVGKVVVNTLLERVKLIANFVTVSGQIENQTNPERLYRSCGFKGEDSWHIVSVNKNEIG